MVLEVRNKGHWAAAAHPVVATPCTRHLGQSGDPISQKIVREASRVVLRRYLDNEAAVGCRMHDAPNLFGRGYTYVRIRWECRSIAKQE